MRGVWRHMCESGEAHECERGVEVGVWRCMSVRGVWRRMCVRCMCVIGVWRRMCVRGVWRRMCVRCMCVMGCGDACV